MPSLERAQGSSCVEGVVVVGQGEAGGEEEEGGGEG